MCRLNWRYINKQFAILRFSSRICSCVVTVYSVYNTTKLSIHSHKLYHHLYADDTQVYISLFTADTDLSLKHVGDCLSDISCLVTNNKLRFNANETNFKVHSDKAANLLMSSLRTSLVIASHHQTLYITLGLHLIAILISENIFL